MMVNLFDYLVIQSQGHSGGYAPTVLLSLLYIISTSDYTIKAKKHMCCALITIITRFRVLSTVFYALDTQ